MEGVKEIGRAGSRRHQTIATILRVAIIAVVVVAFPAIVARSSSKGRALMVFVAGRAGICSLSDSLEVGKVAEAQLNGIEKLERASRMIEVDPTGFQLWETPRGRFWMPSGSGRALLYDLAEQEREIYGQGATGARARDIVLDCGANVGVYTKEALASGADLVVAIEPAPENLECLRRNLREEINEGKVIVYPKGVWDKDGFLPMNIDPRNSAANSFVRNREGSFQSGMLPLTTIDRIVEELQLARVDFIKMDIEGAEQKAIAGATQTIRTHKPRMAICVYHLADDPVMVPHLVRLAVPDYRTKCQCLPRGATTIQAQIVHFY